MTEDRSYDKAEAADILEEAFRTAGSLPKIDFPTFIVSMFHSALMHLGEVAAEGGAAEVNKPMAKQSIDILEMLQTKTEGNLTSEEERLLKTMLYELRMKFVSHQ